MTTWSTIFKEHRLFSRVVIEKLQSHLKILNGKTIGLLGLTFKPDTDDMREAPSLKLIEKLNLLGVKVKAFDPILSQSGQTHLSGQVQMETDVQRLAEDCHALVLVTDWAEFSNIDFKALAPSMEKALMIDGRNFLAKAELEEAGFEYVGIGH